MPDDPATAPAWHKVLDSTTVHGGSAANGHLKVRTAAPNDTFIYRLTGGEGSAWNPSTPGSTLEARINVDAQAKGATGAGSIAILTGTRAWLVSFSTNQINEVVAGGATLMRDTTDAFHVYRFTIAGKDGPLDLYIDNAKSPAISWPGGKTTSNRLDFGDNLDAEAGTVRWDYIRWTNAGAFPPGAKIPPAQQSSASLANGGFEQLAADGRTAQGWEIGPGGSLDTDNAIEGNHSLKYVTDAAGEQTCAVQRGIATSPGKFYRLTYRVRGGKGSADTTGFQRFMVYLSWAPAIINGAAQSPIQQLSGRAWQDALGTWHQRSIEFYAPTSPSAGMVVNCRIQGPGTLWLDDFQFQEIAPPAEAPIRLTIDQPHYRNTIFGDAPIEKIEGAAHLTAEQAQHIEITLLRENDEGPAIVFQQNFLVEKQTARFSVPAGSLADGRYQVRARLAENEAETSVSLQKVPARPDAVRVRADNVILAGGQPFFPLGLWDLPPPVDGKYDEKMLFDLNRAGINTFIIGGEPQHARRLLDQADKYNLRPLISAWPHVLENINHHKAGGANADQRQAWTKAIDQMLSDIRHHPALLGYYLVDEPLWVGFPITPIRQTYDYLRVADPYHPTYINEAPRNTVEAAKPYAAASDLFGLDIYPVPVGPDNGHSDLEDKDLTCVGKYTDRMRAAVDDRKPIVMTLQGFAWGHLIDKTATGIYPTFEQSRFMAYDAIVHGAKGLMYYGTEYIQDESFWTSLLKVTFELRDLSAVLTSAAGPVGAVSLSDDATKSISFIHRVCDGHDYIIAVNGSPSPVKATFRIAAQDKMHVLFENRTIDLTHGEFSDDFDGLSVRIYSSSAQLPRSLVALSAVADPGGEPAYLRDVRARISSHPYAGNANWVWFPGTNTMANASAFFRRTIELPAGIQQASLLITADDRYTCYVNGEPVGQTRLEWTRADHYDITKLLRAGSNVIAIHARDTGSAPCGLLVDLTLKGSNGFVQNLVSDTTWRCAPAEQSGWRDVEFVEDSHWRDAEIVAAYGSGPWAARVLTPP